MTLASTSCRRGIRTLFAVALLAAGGAGPVRTAAAGAGDPATPKGVPHSMEVPSRKYPDAAAFVRYVAGTQGWDPSPDRARRAWSREKRLDRSPFGGVTLGSVGAPDSPSARRDVFLLVERKGQVEAFGPLASERSAPGFNEGVEAARLSVVRAGATSVLWAELVRTTVATGGEDREDVRRVAFVFAGSAAELRCVAAEIPLNETAKKEGEVERESSIVVSFPDAGVMRVAGGRGSPSEAQTSWIGDLSLPK